MKTRIIAVLATLSIASLSAQITIEQVQFDDTTTGRQSIDLGSFTGGLADSVLLVAFSGDTDIDATASFGGTALTALTSGSVEGIRAGWLYLLNPAGTGDVTLGLGGTDVYVTAAAYLVSGVDSSSATSFFIETDTDTTNNNASATASVDLGLDPVNSLLLAAGTGKGSRTDRANITASPALGDQLFDTAGSAGQNFNAIIGSTVLSEESGTYDQAFTGIQQGSVARISSIIALQAVPEPSAFALIAGLLGMGFVMVRRRRTA